MDARFSTRSRSASTGSRARTGPWDSSTRTAPGRAPPSGSPSSPGQWPSSAVSISRIPTARACASPAAPGTSGRAAGSSSRPARSTPPSRSRRVRWRSSTRRTGQAVAVEPLGGGAYRVTSVGDRSGGTSRASAVAAGPREARGGRGRCGRGHRCPLLLRSAPRPARRAPAPARHQRPGGAPGAGDGGRPRGARRSQCPRRQHRDPAARGAHDQPRAGARRTPSRAGGPDAGRQPDVRGDGGADGPRRRALPGREPRSGADGPPGRHRPHRARLRLHDAGLLHHPGVVRARLQHAVGAEGQLAHRPDARADLRDTRRHPDHGRVPGAPGRARRAGRHPAAQGALRRRGRGHRQDDGPLVTGLSHASAWNHSCCCRWTTRPPPGASSTR